MTTKRVNRQLVQAAMMGDDNTVWRFEVTIQGETEPRIIKATWPDMMENKLPELKKQGMLVRHTRVML